MGKKVIIVGDPHIGRLHTIARQMADQLSQEVIVVSPDAITNDGTMVDLKTCNKPFIIDDYPILDDLVYVETHNKTSTNPYARNGNKIFFKKK